MEASMTYEEQIEARQENTALRTRVARLEEALKEILGWRELRDTTEFPIERVEGIARRALEEK